MSEKPPILELTSVAVGSGPGYDTGIWNASLALRPGELALVKLERGHVRLPLADAAQGLAEPAAGAVRFDGRDWSDLPPRQASALRGRIGRVFDASATAGWVSALDVGENILLSARHHTRRPRKELTEEAAKLARAFGLPGLPRGRPGQARPPDLQRAACVRAFMGRPDLLLLERPTDPTYPEILPALLNALRDARARGAAVLWLTADADLWGLKAVRPTFRYAVSGTQLSAADAPGPAPRAGPARAPPG